MWPSMCSGKVESVYLRMLTRETIDLYICRLVKRSVMNDKWVPRARMFLIISTFVCLFPAFCTVIIRS